jgi:phage terminase large subunit
LLKAAERPLKVLCTREIQRTIKDSVHSLLSSQIEAMGLSGFYTITKDAITGQNGSEFIFAGLREQDITKLKSLEGVDICWVEEGQVTTQRSLDVLIPTIRREGSEIWVTFNPELEDDPVYDMFVVNPEDDWIVIPVNYSDNPWFPGVLEDERKRMYRTDDTPGRSKYHWIWEGKCLPAVEGAIFAREVATLYEEGRVRPLDYDNKGRVHGVMDLGYGVMTLALWQRFASTMQLVDYYEMTHSTYAELTAKVRLRS